MTEREQQLETVLREMVAVIKDTSVGRTYPTLRAWAEKFYNHDSPRIRREADVTLRALDLLGMD